MIYNFNICPKCGKTYYEINKSWKDLKQQIKNVLDEKQKSRYEKIIEIQGLLDYYQTIYFKRDDKNE